MISFNRISCSISFGGAGRWNENRAARLAPALCALCALLIFGCGEEPVEKAEEIKVVKLLTLTTLGESGGRNFPGATRATQTAELAFRVAGPLVQFPASEGDVVGKGDVLAQIDPRDFQTAVESIEASLQEAHSQLEALSEARPEDIRRLEANLAARKAEYDEVQLRHDRYKGLLEESVISEQEFDEVKAKYDVGVSNLENARQQLEIGRKGARKEDVAAQEARVAGLEAQLREGQDRLNDTKLLAPFGGVVARTYVENFEDVQAKQPILSIQDFSKIEIDIDISESSVARAAGSGVGIREAIESIDVLVRFGSIPDREFEVALHTYETEADSNTQTFRLTFIMDQPEDVRIIPGMNATVFPRGRSELSDEGESFLIPANAVFADSAGSKTVWVVAPETQRVSARKVVADDLVDERIRVTEGLQSGEVIVISAVNALREGVKVQKMSDF